MRHLDATVVAVGHHRVHPVLALLILVVIGLGIWGAVSWSRRRAQRGSHEDAPWSDASSPVEPSASEEPPLVAPAPPIPRQRERGVGARRPRPVDEGADWAVETYGLTKRFGPTVAVDGVDLRVPWGCAFGYLGPNGAGKTTLIRTLLGLTRSDGGTMRLLGVPVPEERGRALARVGAIVDDPRFHGHLSGEENLRVLAAARGAGAAARIGPVLERVGLSARGRTKVAAYSMGMRQRLGVAACLLGDPDLLILDEPMNGLDPAGMQDMRAMIDGLVDEGRTVVLSSHLLDEVERTCDAVAIVDRGKIIRQGAIHELTAGADTVVEVECTDPAGAAALIGRDRLGEASVADGVVRVTLPSGSTRDALAELNRRLVESGFAVYGFHEVRASLEEWFLSVTSRLGSKP